MTEEKKKISFGFSKLVKKPSVIPSAQPKPAESVEFIKCVEDNNIQVLNEVKREETVLVIPMKEASSSSTAASKPKIKIENPDVNDQPKTLEELAAKEIFDEATKVKKEEEESTNFAVPLVSNPPVGEKESTIEDYESIPVEQYGLAMLRGMGWQPGTGIGKNAQIAPSVTQVVRPKGMGLGADKAIKAAQAAEKKNEDLKLSIGSHVRLTSGSNKDNYGKVEGFIEESGRVIIKLARGGDTVIVGEFMFTLVTAEEYSRNSKVLNISKYEKYKSNEQTGSINVSSGSDSDGNNDKHSRKERSQSQNYSSSSRNSHRSSGQNGSSRHHDDRHYSKSDFKSHSRNYSGREDRSRSHHSDKRDSDRDDYHRSSSKSKKHKKERSSRRD